MVDERLQALIQEDLDGEISAADRAELHRAVLADPEVRKLHAEFKRTDAALRALPAAEPPHGLAQAILDTIPQSPRSESVGGSGTGLRGATLFRYAAVFLGGLVVASLGFYLAEPDGVADPRDLAGTMAGTSDGARVIDQAQIGGDLARAQLRLLRSGGVLVLEAEVTGESEIVVAYDPAAMALTAAASRDGEIRGSDEVAGRVVLASAAGTQLHRLRFHVDEGQLASVDVALRSGGQEVAHTTLDAPAGR